MKNYIIGTLAVIILVLTSLIYKHESSPRHPFPVLEEHKKSDVEVPVLLYLFFSKRNCSDCFDFIQVLNDLPPQFKVFGIVPEDELKEEKELRYITGAAFPLMGPAKYTKHIPWYTPTLVAVSLKGDIIFVLPGVPGEKEYLRKFLDSLYGKLYPLFLNEKIVK